MNVKCKELTVKLIYSHSSTSFTAKDGFKPSETLVEFYGEQELNFNNTTEDNMQLYANGESKKIGKSVTMKVLKNPPDSKYIYSMIPFVAENKSVEKATSNSDHEADKPLDLGDVIIDISKDSQLTELQT